MARINLIQDLRHVALLLFCGLTLSAGIVQSASAQDGRIRSPREIEDGASEDAANTSRQQGAPQNGRATYTVIQQIAPVQQPLNPAATTPIIRPARNVLTLPPAVAASPPPRAPRDTSAGTPAPQPRPAQASQQAANAPRHTEADAGGASVAGRVWRDTRPNLSPNPVLEQLRRVEGARIPDGLGNSGRGSSNADVGFEAAPPRTGSDDEAAPAGTPAMSGRFQVSADYAAGTVAEAQAAEQEPAYRGLGGGVVVEGAARFDGLERMGYDAAYNAIVLNDALAYFAPIPPNELATLARAIAANDAVGVSLGGQHAVFGAAPDHSRLVLDLKVADNFLGDIVFDQGQWTTGYNFAQGYQPASPSGDGSPLIVFFRFNGFEFAVSEGEIFASSANLEVRLFPVSETQSETGAYLADREAISAGALPAQFQANARHLTANINYYRNERIVNRVFAYGETAAILRALKAQGFDLEGLAGAIETFIQ